MSRKKRLAVLTGVILAIISALWVSGAWCASAAAGSSVVSQMKRTTYLQKTAMCTARHIAKLQRKVDRYGVRRHTHASLSRVNRRVTRLNLSVVAVNRTILRQEDAPPTLIGSVLKLNKKVAHLDATVVRLTGKLRTPHKKYATGTVRRLRAEVVTYSRLLAKGRKPGKPKPTPSPTPSPTPTPDPTPSPTPTPTPTPTPSSDPTPTPTPSPTPDPTPSPDPSPVAIDVTAYGARADDGKDDTAAVNAALAAAAASGCQVSFPAGTFEVTTLTAPSGVVIFGSGIDATWLKGRITLSSDTTVRDMKMGAVDSALRFVNGAHDTLLERVHFVGGGSMTSGEQQGVIRFSGGRRADRITFRRCLIGSNERDGNGVSIVDNGWEGATYRDIIWEECYFLGSPRMTFECIQRGDGVHPISTGYRNISFYNCTFEPAGSECISYDGTAYCGWSTLSGNTIKGAGANLTYPWGQGVEFNGVTNMTFVNNTVYRTRGAMINHQGEPGIPSNNVLRNNTFDGRVTFINHVPPATAATIYYNGVSGAVFSGNTVITNVGGQVVYMSDSPSNSFANNLLKDVRPGDTAHQCVWLAGNSSANQFTGNHFYTDWTWGHVCVYDRSNQNRFTTNTFTLLGGRAFSIDSGLTVYQSGNIMQ